MKKDIVYYTKMILSPIVYPVIHLIEGVGFIFDWFGDKWVNVCLSKDIENKIAVAVLYSLFLIIFPTILLCPLWIFDWFVGWVVFSVIGVLASLLAGWIWMDDKRLNSKR